MVAAGLTHDNIVVGHRLMQNHLSTSSNNVNKCFFTMVLANVAKMATYIGLLSKCMRDQCRLLSSGLYCTIPFFSLKKFTLRFELILKLGLGSV